MTTKTRARGALIERFSGIGKPTVDREANVIRGVKVFAFTSKNGRDYSKALKGNAKRLYEGVCVSTDHPPEGGVPSVASRFGVLKNVTEQADGGYADLHFNPKHPNAEQILYAAEKQPELYAMSHRVPAGKYKASRGKDGQLAVESISEVRGVEIVTEGGMNPSLFEAEDPNAPEVDPATGVATDPNPAEPGQDPPEDTPEMTACIARVMAVGKDHEGARAICSAALATKAKPEGEAVPDPDAEEKPAAAAPAAPVSESLLEANVGDKVIVKDYGDREVIGEVLKKAPALLLKVGDCLRTVWEDGAVIASPAVASATATESIMGNKTLAELTEADLRAARPDAFVAKDADAKELKEFREKAAAQAIADAAKAKVAEVRTLCETAKLAAALITDTFLESLVPLDDAKRKALIEERKTVRSGPNPTSTLRETKGAPAPGAKSGETLTPVGLMEALHSN